MCTASKVVSVALNEIGYLEKASNSNLDNKTANAGSKNYTKYARDLDNIAGFYNGKKQGYSWCDVFTDWCFVQAFGVDKAKELLCQPNNSLGAGCGYSMNYYKAKGQFYTKPAIGDQIFFKSGSSITHTGIVYDVDKSYVYTVEGNTSGVSGVVANGGGVCAKKYSLSYSKIAGYGRPAYDEEVKEYKPTVLEWQKAAIADGFKFPKAGADGKWGSECRSVVKNTIVKQRKTHKHPNLTKLVQKIVGTEVDGKCGPDTDRAIKAWQKQKGLSADGAFGPASWSKALGVK